MTFCVEVHGFTDLVKYLHFRDFTAHTVEWGSVHVYMSAMCTFEYERGLVPKEFLWNKVVLRGVHFFEFYFPVSLV